MSTNNHSLMNHVALTPNSQIPNLWENIWSTFLQNNLEEFEVSKNSVKRKLHHTYENTDSCMECQLTYRHCGMWILTQWALQTECSCTMLAYSSICILRSNHFAYTVQTKCFLLTQTCTLSENNKFIVYLHQCNR